MIKKKPKLNPGILEEVFHLIKIVPGNDEEEPEEYPLTNFMLSGKEPFNLALNYYNQMKEARIGQKDIGYKNVGIYVDIGKTICGFFVDLEASYQNEEYTIYRKFPLFNIFGQILLASQGKYSNCFWKFEKLLSVEKITCLKNYPKDLPLFKNVKNLKELISDAFYVLTYSKQFSSIEFIEKVELSTNVKDMMEIHKLPFACNELCLKDYGFSRFMKKKIKKFSILNEVYAAITSPNLNSIKNLTIEDYIDENDIPNLKFNEIAKFISIKFQNLQNFTVIFILYLQDNLNIIDLFTEEFIQDISDGFPNIQFTINFELHLSCLKQSHVDFYDAIIQDPNYQINQEEKTAKRQIISASNKCILDILFSFG